MTAKAVALISGGLDSTLAVKVVQRQGIEIEGLNVRTQFECCSLDAQQIAHQLGVRLNFVTSGPEYLDLVQYPRFGRGKGINPCVDCRIYMFQAAKRLMHACGASFLITGEVLGQRPMSQKRHDFTLMEEELGLQRRILRPLSAKRLPLTIPEEEGLIDRERLYGIQGRSRQELIALAHELGMEDKDIPTPSVGCALTEPAFGVQVLDVFEHQDAYGDWDFQLLRIGRQFRVTEQVKLALGRSKEDNDRLCVMAKAGTTLFEPANFNGPAALAVGPVEASAREIIGRILMRYTKRPGDAPMLCETAIVGDAGVRGESREYAAPAPFAIDEAEAYAVTGQLTARV